VSGRTRGVRYKNNNCVEELYYREDMQTRSIKKKGN
jgi:hypothetical protein